MCHRTEEKEGVVVFAFCCSILSLDVSKDRQKEEKTKSRISTMPILLIILLITVARKFHKPLFIYHYYLMRYLRNDKRTSRIVVNVM